MLENRGQYKGFTNEEASNLLKLGEYGPLDHARNDSRKDSQQHKLDKLSNNMNSYA